MHTPGQLGQPACTRDSDHANNRQTDRADRKSDKGQPRVSARLCAEIRRENQVSGAKNMENSVKPTRSGTSWFNFLFA